METLFTLAIVILGLLVMFGIVRPSSAFGYIIGFCAFIIFAPVLLSAARQQASGFWSGPHAWWEYVIAFFAVLVVLRIILDTVFNRRGR
jgi:hypothetical protein